MNVENDSKNQWSSLAASLYIFFSQEQGEAFAASECFTLITPFERFIDSGAYGNFMDNRGILEDFTPIHTGSLSVNGIGGMSLDVERRGKR